LFRKIKKHFHSSGFYLNTLLYKGEIMENDKKKWGIEQLQNVISMRIDEHHTWVYIFITSLTTTSILLVALFNTGKFPPQSTGIVICFFGCFISVVLLYIQERALITMKAHEDIRKEIEEELQLPDSTKNIPKASFVSARPLMSIVGIIQILGWGIGFLFFFCMLICKMYNC
jgi:hypothetical protein